MPKQLVNNVHSQTAKEKINRDILYDMRFVVVDCIPRKDVFSPDALEIERSTDSGQRPSVPPYSTDSPLGPLCFVVAP